MNKLDEFKCMIISNKSNIMIKQIFDKYLISNKLEYIKWLYFTFIPIQNYVSENRNNYIIISACISGYIETIKWIFSRCSQCYVNSFNDILRIGYNYRYIHVLKWVDSEIKKNHCDKNCLKFQFIICTSNNFIIIKWLLDHNYVSEYALRNMFITLAIRCNIKLCKLLYSTGHIDIYLLNKTFIVSCYRDVWFSMFYTFFINI